MEKITLTSKTRQCVSPNSFLGYEGENEANKLIFEFTDGFKDGVGILNLQRGEQKGYVSLNKVGETYEFPVKSSILSQAGAVEFQVVITENNGTVTKYDKFIMTVKDAIDTDAEMPEEYPSWVEMANEKLAEVEEAIVNAEEATQNANNVASELLEARENGEFNGQDGKDGIVGKDGVSPTFVTEQIEGGAKITITDVDGTHEVNLSNGKDGIDGQDGKSPTATVEETTTGAKITITDVNGTTTANIYNGKDGADGEGGGIAEETDPLYTADKPKLALKTDIPTKLSELNNDEGFITDYTESDPLYTADKSKLALKTEIPTKVSQLENDSKYITSYTETDPIYLADKPNLALKTEIPDITGKQDTLVSGENIKTINGESILGSGNIVIEGGSGGSGGSGSYTEAELLSEPYIMSVKSSAATILNTNVTLDDDITKYDQIVFAVDLKNNTGYFLQTHYPKLVSGITYTTEPSYSKAQGTFDLTVTWNGGGTTIDCATARVYFMDSKTLRLGYVACSNSSYSGFRISSIKGIKY